MARGKGIKILGVPSKKYNAGQERMVAVALLQPKQGLVVQCGGRKMTIKAPEIKERYFAERGRRGSLLPKNYRKVDFIEPDVAS
jgi:topoisomerase IV subunit A